MVRVSLNKTPANTVIVMNHMYNQYWHSHKLKRRDIELLFITEKCTSGNLGQCSITDLRIFLSGGTQWNAYKTVNSLIDRGYVTNAGTQRNGCKKRLTLSPEGTELVRSIYSSITERISYLNDKLKLRAELKRQKLKKGLPGKKSSHNKNPDLPS